MTRQISHDRTQQRTCDPVHIKCDYKSKSNFRICKTLLYCGVCVCLSLYYKTEFLKITNERNGKRIEWLVQDRTHTNIHTCQQRFSPHWKIECGTTILRSYTNAHTHTHTCTGWTTATYEAYGEHRRKKNPEYTSRRPTRQVRLGKLENSQR